MPPSLALRAPGASVYLRLLLLLAIACLASPAAGAETIEIRITSNGWHTGIALPRAAIDAVFLPELADFPNDRQLAQYLEFGWGDAAFYQVDQPGISTTLKAALVPTKAVMHVAGLDQPPERYFKDPEIVRLRLSAIVATRLVRRIAASFERPASGRGKSIAKGLYPNSRFYPAKGRFHLFNTCNSWTARTLAAAGIPIDAAGVVSAGDVVDRLRTLIKRHGSNFGQLNPDRPEPPPDDPPAPPSGRP